MTTTTTTAPTKKYTTVRPAVLEAHKAQTGLGFADICRYMHARLKRTSAIDASYTRGLIEYFCATMELSVANGKAMHLYVSAADLEFFTWLVDCVPNFKPEYAQAVSAMLNGAAGVLHFPTSTGLASALFACNGVGSARASLGVAVSPNTQGTGYSTCTVVYDGQPVQPVEYGSAQWYAKLITAIGLYTLEFPEAVLAGIPRELVKTTPANQLSRTIGVSDRCGTHASPVTHVRNAHTRTLRSERYTLKRGAVIEIKGTQVRGRSAVVLTVNTEESYAS